MLLRLIRDRTSATGQYAKAIPTLEQFLATERAPEVAALATVHLGYYRWHVGQFSECRDTWDSLGFLDDWWLIGPFENERGSGFGVATEVETKVDLEQLLDGKRNPVRWRRVSGAGRGGMIEIGQLVRPAEEALAYLHTHVYVEHAIDAELRVGSTGAYAAWIDGNEMARVDVERRLHFDQDAFPIRLEAGWHSILIKSGHTKGAWALRARLCSADGTPIVRRVQADAPSEPVFTANSAGRSERSDAGALRALEAAGDAPAIDLIRGYLIADRTAHDANTHPDRERFRRANDVAPTAVGTYFLADTFARTITHTAEREENRWREMLERTIELDPAFDRATLDLANYSQSRFGNLTRATELIEPLISEERRAAGPSLRALAFAAAMMEARLGGPAAESFRQERTKELLDTTPAPRVRMQEARRLRSEGKLGEARKLLERGLALDAVHRSMRRALVDLTMAEREFERAKALLSIETQAFPHHSSPHVSVAELSASLDDYVSALNSIDRSIALAPQDESLYQRRGEYLLFLDQAPAAAAAFRHSLELDPNQPRLRDYVDRISATTSHFGENERIDTAALIARALEREEPDNDTHRVLLDHLAIRLNRDGTSSRYAQFVARVINDQGTRGFDYYPIPYAFGEQWVEVLSARVHRPGGRVEDARIRNRDPEVREGEYPVWSRAWVDLPPLEPGDVVEIEYRIEDLKQSFFGDYFGERVVFGNTVPVDRKVFSLSAPKEKPLYFHSPRLDLAPVVEETDDAVVRRWDVRNLTKLDPEPGMPRISEIAPVLEVSTFESWNAFAQWYHHLIRKQFESSAEIRAKVAELTEGATSEADKIRAIYDFIVTDVRYIAWEFGVHGFKPYNASTIFTRRFGDCKDKATLLCTMLDEVGIEAHPVLIYGDRARPQEDLTLPLVHHFNHCIAYIETSDGKGLFVDGTAEHHSVNQLPLMDRGAKVLIVREEGGELADVPWNRPDEQSVTERARVRVAADGSAKIEQHDALTGDYAVSIRGGLEIEGQRRRRLEQLFASRYPGVTVDKVETSELGDLSDPVWLRIELTVPDYVNESGDGLALPPIRDLFQSISTVSGTATKVERAHDLVLGNPTASQLEVRIELPPGYEVSHVPDAVTHSAAGVEVSFSHERDGNTLVLRREIQRSQPRVDAKSYSKYRNLVEQVEQLGNERIRLRRAGEVD
ncbi:MAG: DUF3857 domain-containing protein [Planctomycetota bacterium]